MVHVSEALRLPCITHEEEDGREYAVPAHISRLGLTVPADLMEDLREAGERAAEVSAALRSAPAEYQAGVRLAEAIANSRLERLYAPTDKVACALVAPRPHGEAKVIAAAVSSALSVEQGADITDVHAPLLLAQGGDSVQYAGVYRPVRVRIGEHLCPLPARVPGLMDDLLAFGRRDDLDPILQATVFHAQFETIHPFADGNGRSGRAILSATIGLSMSIPMHWKRSHRAYIGGLIAYRAGDIAPLLRCVIDSAWASAHLVERFLSRQPALPQVRADALAHRVARWLVGQPAVTSTHIVQEFGANKMSAKRALDALERDGLVDEVTGGARNRVFVSAHAVAGIDDMLIAPMYQR